MYKAKAYSATSATSPLASTTISRREPTEHDVQLEILFCGICHSDLHTVRNEWSEHVPTVYPCVPAMRSSAVSPRSARRDQVQARRRRRGWVHGRFRRHLPECRAGLEQFCPNMILTFNSRTAPRRRHLWWLLRWHRRGPAVRLRVPSTSISRELRRSSAPESPLTRRCAAGRHHQGKESRSGRPRRTGAHGRESFAHAFGAHVVVFTTSPNKKEDALRLGADEVVVSRNANEMQKARWQLRFHPRRRLRRSRHLTAYIQLLRRDANLTLVGAPAKPLAVAEWAFCSDAAASPARSSVVSRTQEMLDFCGAHNIHRRCRNHPHPKGQRSLRETAQVRCEVPLLHRYGFSQIRVNDFWPEEETACELAFWVQIDGR